MTPPSRFFRETNGSYCPVSKFPIEKKTFFYNKSKKSFRLRRKKRGGVILLDMLWWRGHFGWKCEGCNFGRKESKDEAKISREKLKGKTSGEGVKGKTSGCLLLADSWNSYSLSPFAQSINLCSIFCLSSNFRISPNYRAWLSYRLFQLVFCKFWARRVKGQTFGQRNVFEPLLFYFLN